MRRLIAAGVAALALGAAPAHAGTTQESTFQDDNLLVYGEPATVIATLDTLRSLGADRLRLSVFWKVLAPAAGQDVKPGGFDAADPATYPPGAWDRYDRLVREAAARGLAVNFNLTGPGPDWATGDAPRADLDPIHEPDPREFGLFVRAVGTRYSGTYAGPDGQALPRVEHWSVWNEPNQAGWLAPQWVDDPRAPGAMVEASPRIYRTLVDAAWGALHATGHGDDTILIGETAPKGLRRPGAARSMPPGRFIRRLFCVDQELRPLQGSSAELLGCPADGDRRRFAERHPGLLRATGWSHHPYELARAPTTHPGNPDWFTIANLPELQSLLRRIRRAHGRGGIPLHLTEFGYQTNPPDPLGVSPGRQAAYLDLSEFVAWRNPGVRTLAQFLLDDDAPLPGYPTNTVGAWGSTFQSGLRTRAGRAKPALRSYQLPIHLPAPRVRRGAGLRVWGLARGAAGRPRVQVLLRTGRGRERVVRTVRGTGHGYVDTRVRVRRSGAVRLRHRNLDGRLVVSRSVRFSVRR